MVYGKPLFVVENGIGLKDEPDDEERIDDAFRREYVRGHVAVDRVAHGIRDRLQREHA